jgi:hypothetical protein
VPPSASTGTSASTLDHVPAAAPHTRLQAGIQKPKIYTDGTIRYVNLSTCEEPLDLIVAMADPHWREAMNSEFSALICNMMWHLVPPSAGWNLIDCIWVFKIKRKSDRSIDRYKVRLVAKGFKQQYGIDLMIHLVW